MILIAAALQEELRAGLDLCASRTRFALRGVRAWSGSIGSRDLAFLKTGVGPDRASEALRRLMSAQHPTRILVIGYAGGLAPELRVGDLIVPDQALLLENNPAGRRVAGRWSLELSQQLRERAREAGFQTRGGACVTSPGILGEPAQKRAVHEELGAVSVDMETAALAREAALCGIPLLCVRAISDTAEDRFLAPFAADPSIGPIRRAARVLSSGHLLTGYSEWRDRAAVARAGLCRFLKWYLDPSRPTPLETD